MAFEVSPAVERVAEAARDWANRRGSADVRLEDWLLGLLADEDGKPAALLERVGVSPESVRAVVDETGREHGTYVPVGDLYDAARDRSIALRADPALTTDFLLLAVLEAHPPFREFLASHGLRADAVANLLRSSDIGWGQDRFQVVDGPAPTETPSEDPHTAARVVDANLNRAREALRVIEDYCRFVRDDAGQTERVKSLRHRLAAATGLLPAELLLTSRDTPGDVGTAVTAGAEYERRSSAQIAAVNLKRLQEALRSAEEFGKLIEPNFGRAVEQIRYEAYTLEQALLAGSDLRKRLADAKLYVLVSADRCRDGLERTVAEMIAGGVQVVQLREKGVADRELLHRARTVRRVTRDAGALFVVNDRPDIAKLADADGVHLGQDDLTVADTRRIVGPGLLVGVSTHDIEQVRRATSDGADYIGVGPTFPSRTKNFDAFPGLAFLREAAKAAAVPAFALGGIDRHNLAQVLETGIARVAVGAAVVENTDVREAASVLRRILDPTGTVVRP